MLLRFLLLPVLLSAATLAHADNYQFDYSGADPFSYECEQFNICQYFSATWTLSSTPDSYTATSATYNSVDVGGDIVGFSGFPSAMNFYTSSPEKIYTSDPYTTDAGATLSLIFPQGHPATPFYSGPTSSLSFNQGTYQNTQLLFYDYSELYGPLTITDLSTSAVPEPSTFALLGTGVLGAAGLFRRRVHARRLP